MSNTLSLSLTNLESVQIMDPDLDQELFLDTSTRVPSGFPIIAIRADIGSLHIPT